MPNAKYEDRFWRLNRAMWFLGRALCFVSILGFAALPARAVTVDISVQSEKGPPVRKTLVTIVRNAADTAGPSVMYRNVTDAKGEFSLDVPDSGNYLACAGSAEAELLDSCLWPNKTADFSVPDPATNGAKKVRVKLVLQLGVTLRVRVDDPKGLLPTSVNPKRDGFLQAGVWADGRFRFARLASFDDKSLNYEMVVPVNGDLHISFQAFNVKVLDENSAPMDPKNPTISFKTQASESSRVRRFSVVPGN